VFGCFIDTVSGYTTSQFGKLIGGFAELLVNLPVGALRIFRNIKGASTLHAAFQSDGIPIIPRGPFLDKGHVAVVTRWLCRYDDILYFQ
jgi:hypothetical protein